MMAEEDGGLADGEDSCGESESDDAMTDVAAEGTVSSGDRPGQPNTLWHLVTSIH